MVEKYSKQKLLVYKCFTQKNDLITVNCISMIVDVKCSQFLYLIQF